MNFCLYESRLAAFRRRVLSFDPGHFNTGWEEVLMPQGMAVAGKAWEDAELLAWHSRWIDRHVAQGVTEDPSNYIWNDNPVAGIFLAQYSGNWGFPLAVGGRADEPEIKNISIQVCDYILNQARRLADGVLAHGAGEKDTVWVDTLYFSSSVLAETYTFTKDERYAIEAVRQLNLHAKLLRDPITGAFFHDCRPGTMFRTSGFWSRGNGWVILAYADTLRCCPASTPGWSEAMEAYRSLVAALLRWQHPCGLWRINPECPEAHLETSGTVMIATGIAIGAGEGWIEDTLAAHAWKATAELFSWIRKDGSLVGAQKPAGTGGWETHKQSMLGECDYATALFLRLQGELKRYNFISSQNGKLPS